MVEAAPLPLVKPLLALVMLRSGAKIEPQAPVDAVGAEVAHEVRDERIREQIQNVE